MSTFSIDGLISGLNTTEVIGKLLEIERAPVRQLQARRSEADARLAAWRTLNTKLTTLEDRARALAVPLTYAAARATSTNTAVLVASASPGAALGTYTVTVNRLASAHQIATATTFADKDAEVFGTGTLTIQVGAQSKDVTISQGQNSLTGIAAAINAANAGVHAAVVQVDGGYRLLLTSKTSGAGGAITVTDNLTGGSQALGSFTEVTPAQDAEIVLGSGAGAITVHRSTNVVSDLLPGVTLALAGTGSVTVTVERDQEAIRKAVRDFVAAYNDLSEAMAQYGRYNASTKERGVLQGDGTLQRIQRLLPDDVLETEVAGQSLKRLSDLGVRLGRDGKLTLDESKLTDALEGRFEEAKAVLQAAGGRLRDDTDALTRTDGAVWAAIDALNNRITGFDRRIQTLEERVERKRAELVRMFTNLERALGQLRAQGDWLTSQIRQLEGSGR
jgi:flagellar hook-associated protein 2